jgi:hypothetical protein
VWYFPEKLIKYTKHKKKSGKRQRIIDHSDNKSEIPEGSATWGERVNHVKWQIVRMRVI